MLALKRHVDQAIEIHHEGETLVLLVTDIGKGWVKLGFEGPRSFAIVRDDAKTEPPLGAPSDRIPNGHNLYETRSTRHHPVP